MDMFEQKERITVASKAELDDAIRQIVGLKVTAASFCIEYGWTLEFDHRIRLQIDVSGEDTWYKLRVV